MRTVQRKTAIVLLAALLLVVTACSGNANDPDNAAGEDNGSANQQGTNTVVNDDEGEPVTIRIMSTLGSAEVPEDDPQRAFVDVVEEALNVNLEFIAPPASGYESQLQLTLISGDLPDVVFFPSEDNEMYINAVNDGVIVPINDYLEDADNLMAHSYEHSWSALKTMGDDNIYAIPRTSITRNDGFTVRKDWMDNLGIPVPENSEMSVEEFTDMLHRFTFDDPDGNGKDDTYGFGSFVDANKILQPVLTSELGHYGWQAYGGGEYDYTLPEYDRNSDVYANVLGYTRDLYASGVLDPDSPINDNKTASERFERGITGVVRDFAGYVKRKEDALHKLNPEAELTYLFVQGPEGEVKGGVYGTGIWGVWAITSAAEHPEKAVEVFDYLLSDEGWDLVSYGMEGTHYTMENGERVYSPEAGTMYMQRNIVRRHDDPDFFLHPTSYTEADKELVRPWIQKAVDTAVVSLDQGHTPAAAREPKFMDYKLTWDELTTRIMLGDLPMEQLGPIRDDWYKHGGEAYMEQMNDYIRSTQ
ncbi:extracellular solute-binding protein [Paenibacillus sp. IB182496]|uniref:Extracellular solute-binding protein n=1 Tax=Paenibacillus sabuli TaxID=2772509 RepID=A0A927BQQ3_9BACL|nr:extracellular solute-binding protein [Paenibacillus sabuli]MBD2843804.1 extracellular solute-binding protein [Paenibacillus sabuli]